MPMTTVRTTVWVTSQFEAFHSWDNAPKDVTFLRSIHRHIFHVKVGMPVHHNDRDIEFFQFKDRLDRLLYERYKGRTFLKSCEMIANEILIHFNAKFVEVSEDNENGATVERVS